MYNIYLHIYDFIRHICMVTKNVRAVFYLFLFFLLGKSIQQICHIVSPQSNPHQASKNACRKYTQFATDLQRRWLSWEGKWWYFIDARSGD